MDWSRLWSLPIGEAVPADPTEAFRDVEPIIEVTETIRPREVMISHHADGSDMMVTLLEDREKGAFTLRARHRLPDDRKRVAPRVAWTPAEEGGIPRALSRSLTRIEKTMRTHGGKVTRLTFPSGASIEDILAAFVKSGAFDVLQGDPEKKEIRRLA